SELLLAKDLRTFLRNFTFTYALVPPLTCRATIDRPCGTSQTRSERGGAGLPVWREGGLDCTRYTSREQERPEKRIGHCSGWQETLRLRPTRITRSISSGSERHLVKLRHQEAGASVRVWERRARSQDWIAQRADRVVLSRQSTSSDTLSRKTCVWKSTSS